MKYLSADEKQRKIIHVDMDCFYAAIEIRDNPALVDKPVAVGGSPEKRGVICTCNYIARRYGVHSAMATSLAYRHCPDLVVLPVDMSKYRQVASHIHAIFSKFTDKVEPLALDEAYLDVTDVKEYHGSATWIAKAIQQCIWESSKLTASAGVASNKFLAKIASGRNKPNGLFVIRPDDTVNFIKTLPIDELFGVGQVTARKLHRLGLKTCLDLQALPLSELIDKFGKLGEYLYEQCRGIDYRPVEPNKIRKSLSVEQTFPRDISNSEDCIIILRELFSELLNRLQETQTLPIKNQYIKIKFNNFRQKTAETVTNIVDLEKYLTLFRKLYDEDQRPIRLLGLGVHFAAEKENIPSQTSLF